MSLEDVQKTIQRVCVDIEADGGDLESLGDASVWAIYRDMVRRRLYGELKRVFRRSHALAGDAEFAARFDALLQGAPPTGRRFADVPLWFARAVVPLWREDSQRPAPLADLLAYEALRWEVSDLLGDVGRVEEFGFDAAAVLSPTLRLIELGHAVHRDPDESGHYAAGPCYVALCRPSDDSAVKMWTLNHAMFELLSQLQAGPVTVTDAVRAVAERTGAELTQRFVEELCGALANFIERGVILGSR